MVSALLLVGVVFSAVPEEAAKATELAAYQGAKAKVGHDSEAHVKLALWCEAHGLEAERIKHLAIAVLIDPRQPLARRLMGLVEYQGRWQHPDAVREKAKADALLLEYQTRRAKGPDTADGHWALALWCEEKGLAAEARAHLTAVTLRDPRREAAWKRLGYKKHQGRWITDAQLAEANAEAERQKHADAHWKPLLEKWRSWLGDKSRRDRAQQALADVTDPRAVPAILAVFAAGDASKQAVAARMLGQIDAPRASRALAVLAIFGKSSEVRRAASETLKQRDAREFADLLVALIRDPIQYEVRPVGGPGSPGELAIRGKKANVKRRYSPPRTPSVPLLPGDKIVYDANGLPVIDRAELFLPSGVFYSASQLPPIFGPDAPLAHKLGDEIQSALSQQGLRGNDNQIAARIAKAEQNATFFNPNAYEFAQLWAASAAANPVYPSTSFSPVYTFGPAIPVGQMQLEAQRSAVAAQQQLQNDAAALEQYNQSIKPLNDRVVGLLAEISGQNFGPDRDAWSRWWVDQIGYALLSTGTEVPTIIEDVPLDYQAQPVPVSGFQGMGIVRISCFGAGTLVHTLTGLRPIERLRVGDRVLTQDIKTGALGYHPILLVHHNPPSKTFRVALGDEVVVSSEFHRFWISGKGWVMARDLKVGQTVRTLDGLARITSLESGGVQPVFNLDVADDADFFVGRLGALVHDNTLPDPASPPSTPAPHSRPRRSPLRTERLGGTGKKSVSLGVTELASVLSEVRP